MDDVLLLNSAEKFLNGEMSQPELEAFEALRKSNPLIDQAIVEHIHFLKKLSTFSATKNIKQSIKAVENKLLQEGVIANNTSTGKAKVVYLWNKYKRNIAIAASIASIVSIASTLFMVNYAKKYGAENYQELVSKINQTNVEINKLKSDTTATHKNSNQVKVDYRATGFLIDGKGYLITNAHVIGKMKNVYVKNSKGIFFTADVIYKDNTSDLALVKISDSSFKSMPNLPYSINKMNANLGEQFFTLGFPKNEIVYGEGYVSAKSGNDGDSTSYQLTVSANPGNSGAPIINKSGEIIGVLTGKDSKADGVVYAAKSKNIFTVLEKYKKEDATNKSIKMPINRGLAGLDRVQQIKKMQDYVFMIVGN